jgi:predicted small lipoprotein YifL
MSHVYEAYRRELIGIAQSEPQSAFAALDKLAACRARKGKPPFPPKKKVDPREAQAARKKPELEDEKDEEDPEDSEVPGEEIAKTSAAKGEAAKSLIQKLPKGARGPASALVLAGSLYGGLSVGQSLKPPPNAQKLAAARLGANPILRIRGASKLRKRFQKLPPKSIYRVPSPR